MNKRTVLICDQNTADSEVMQHALNVEGFKVLLVRDGEAARQLLGEHQVDLVIMETRLPDCDGLELCRRLRGESDVPIIFVSSRCDEFDVVLGFKMGADDYVRKPFFPRELAARAEAVLRRGGHDAAAGEKGVSIGGLRLQPESFSAWADGRKLALIPSDFKLLSYMAANPGKVLTREKMLDAVWGYEYYGSQRSVDTQIKRIRAALRGCNVHFAIKSIYGVGYKLELEEANVRR